MKLKVHHDFNSMVRFFNSLFGTDQVVSKDQIKEDVFFMVVEKYYFRNSSRASLSICLVDKRDWCEVVLVGSGGGQGLLMKFDWGAGTNFEVKVLKALENQSIRFEEIGKSNYSL